jgi:hypothetical protein
MNELPAIFQQLNTEMFGNQFQYYYRRGQVFYFRSPDNEHKLCLYTSPKETKRLIKQLVFRKVYLI